MARQQREEAGGKKKKREFQGVSGIIQDTPGKYKPAFEEEVEPSNRIVATTAGLQKRGKTQFGLSMPKPMLYQQFDTNYEHALKKARDEAKKKKQKDAIQHLSYFADPRGDIQAANAAEFERFVRDYDYGIDDFKSIFIDTVTELMDVRKIAEWGRLSQIPQIYYGSIYADFRWLVKRAMGSNCNVVFAHRLRKQYVDNEWKGDYELQGWPGIVYETQVYLEHNRDDEGEFSTTIVECAQEASLMGIVLADDENDFKSLATKIFPDSNEEDWV